MFGLTGIVSPWREQTSLPLSGTPGETPPGVRKPTATGQIQGGVFGRCSIVQRREALYKKGRARVRAKDGDREENLSSYYASGNKYWNTANVIKIF